MRMWLHCFKQVPLPQPQRHVFFVSKFLELIMKMHIVIMSYLIFILYLLRPEDV